MGVFINGWQSSRRVAPHAVSLLVTAPEPVLTLEEGKARAGLDWVPGDSRDALMTGFIAAAAAKVERDTGLALRTQTRDVYLDAWPVGSWPIRLPPQSTPLQSVTSVQYTDTGAVLQTVEATRYVVDLARGRILLANAAWWPTDLGTSQPIVIRIVSGYANVAAIPPLLVHAVGLLTAHYATRGRDLTSAEGSNGLQEVPHGYSELISSYIPVTVA